MTNKITLAPDMIVRRICAFSFDCALAWTVTVDTGPAYEAELDVLVIVDTGAAYGAKLDVLDTVSKLSMLLSLPVSPLVGLD